MLGEPRHRACRHSRSTPGDKPGGPDRKSGQRANEQDVSSGRSNAPRRETRCSLDGRIYGTSAARRLRSGVDWCPGHRSHAALRGCDRCHLAYHEPHSVVLPEAHGESSVRGMLGADGSLDVAEVSAAASTRRRSPASRHVPPPRDRAWRHRPRADQEPGERYEDGIVRPALEGIFALAGRERINANELRAAGHLCPCAARGEEAERLRSIVGGTAGGDGYATSDEARHETARIVAKTIGGVGPHVTDLASTVCSADLLWRSAQWGTVCRHRAG